MAKLKRRVGLYGLTQRWLLAITVFFAGSLVSNAAGAISWTPHPVLANFHDVIFDGNQFWAVGDNGLVQVSPDGATWTSAAPGPSLYFYGIAHGGGGQYVVVGAGSGGTNVDYSVYVTNNGGLTWSQATVSSTWFNLTFFSVAHGATAGEYVAVGGGGVIRRSTDGGATWSPSPQSWYYYWLSKVIYAPIGTGLYVIVGDSGSILTSSDGGITWTAQYAPDTVFLPIGNGMNLYDVAYANGLLVAVGWDNSTSSGVILTSPDGINWTQVTPNPTAEPLHGVTHGPCGWVAVGANGTVLISPNGTSWTAETSSTTAALRRVAYGNNRYVAVGEGTTLVGLCADGSPDLAISKTAAGPLVAGQLGSYQITVSNVGTASMPGPIAVTDTLPADLTFVSATGTGWTCSASGQTVTCTHPGPVPAGESLPAITLNVNVSANPASQVVVNCATVTGPLLVGQGKDATTQPLDPNPANDTSCADSPVQPGGLPDLAGQKTRLTSPVVAGQPVTYQITATNVGTSPYTGWIQIADWLPTGVSSPTFSAPAPWSCSVTPWPPYGPLVACTYSGGPGFSLQPGQSLPPVTITFVVPAGATSVLNCADIVIETADAHPDNNRSCDLADVQPAGASDLEIVKRASGTPWQVGGTGAFSISVSNVGSGPVPAGTVVTVTENLPAGLTLTGVSGTGWTCSPTSGSGPLAVTCTYTVPAGGLAPGASLPPINFIVEVKKPGPYTNCASVKGTLQGAVLQEPTNNNESCIEIPTVPSEPRADLGDAPDSTNHFNKPMAAYAGVLARFPTVFDSTTGLPQGPKHLQPKGLAWLGKDVSFEDEADLLPDADGVTNIDPGANAADRDKYDDGVLLPIVIPLMCGQTQFQYTVTSTAAAKLYVNVWIDFNRDGDWDDPMQKCPLGPTVTGSFTEWAVQNELITVPGPGTFTFTTPPFGAANPTKGADMWMRITLTDHPIASVHGADGSGPATGYKYGETEDYLLRLEYGEICGVKFHDLNGNGKQDPGEPGLAGWGIEVKDAHGNIMGYAVTDANGKYCIVVPSPGTYTVTEQVQPGWTPTTPTTHTVTVVPGQTVGVLFGNREAPVGRCDLAIAKKITPSPVPSGGQVTVTLTVTNVGTAACAGPTTVTETIPPSLSFVSASGAGWSFLAFGGNVICTYPGTIPAGGSTSITLVFSVTAKPGTRIENCATLLNANDTNPANNRDCAVITVTEKR